MVFVSGQSVGRVSDLPTENFHSSRGNRIKKLIEQKANSYDPLFLQSPKFGGADVGGAGSGWLGVLAMVLNRSRPGQPMVEVPVPTSQMFDYLIAA